MVIDPFCDRQFVEGGTLHGVDREAFEAKVNELHAAGAPLVDGYAPFCKHVFMPNFVPTARTPYLEITEANQQLLRSGYEARTEQELPVLMRWFDGAAMPSAPPTAKFLDIILYSREQIRKEAAAMGRTDEQDAPWGIISVKPQDVDHELPMNPITMMRNALGAEEGGSGVGLVRAEYDKSVAFWSKHALIKFVAAAAIYDLEHSIPPSTGTDVGTFFFLE